MYRNWFEPDQNEYTIALVNLTAQTNNTIVLILETKADK